MVNQKGENKVIQSMFLGEVRENQITFVVAKRKQKKGTSTDSDVIVGNILIVY